MSGSDQTAVGWLPSSPGSGEVRGGDWWQLIVSWCSHPAHQLALCAARQHINTQAHQHAITPSIQTARGRSPVGCCCAQESYTSSPTRSATICSKPSSRRLEPYKRKVSGR
jgi:hypothetical protein